MSNSSSDVENYRCYHHMVIVFTSNFVYTLIDCHVLNSIPTPGKVFAIQPHVIKFVSDMVSVDIEHKYNRP